MEHYEFLLKKISDKIKNPSQKKYIKKHLNSIVEDLFAFSKYFSKIVDISFENISLS